MGCSNFLFFRADHAGMSEAVYQAIEEQAATNLAKVKSRPRSIARS